MKKIIQTLGCLIVGASSLTAGVTVDITFANPSDTVLTATISGQDDVSNFVGTTLTWDNDYAQDQSTFGWDDLIRDSGENILKTGGSFKNIVVSNSNATASFSNRTITVTHVGFFYGCFN